MIFDVNFGLLSNVMLIKFGTILDSNQVDVHRIGMLFVELLP